MTLAKVYISVLFSVYLIGTEPVVAQGLSSLLSRLYNSAAQNNRPLVLIIDRNNLRKEQKPPSRPSNLALSSSEDEEGIQPAVFLIQSQVPKSPATPPPLKRLPPVRGLAALGGLGLGLGGLSSVGGFGGVGGLGGLASLGSYGAPAYRPRGRYPPKVYKGPLKVPGRSTPLPMWKLLRQSECDASQACMDKCKDQFGGKKRTKCKAKCEITYECVPVEDDYDDPCEDDEMPCGDRNPSTRGIILVTSEKPPCTRC